MTGQFREPGRAERLEVAAFEALIDAEHTEARRLRSAQMSRYQPDVATYWPDDEAATEDETTPNRNAEETT